LAKSSIFETRAYLYKTAAIRMFKTPESNYPSYFEKSKFSVTWSIFVFLVFVFSGLCISHGLTADPSILSSSFALLFSIIALIILVKTREYKLVALTAAISGTIICQYSMFIIDDSERVSDLMWILLVTFYIFYTLGSKWGGIILTTNLTGLLIKVTLFTESIQQLGIDHHIKTIVNVAISTVAVGFIIHKLISSSERNNRELNSLNIQLENKNEEKSVLLKEIHHRVKNNLQVVSSLLRLQANELTDETAKDQFSEAISRISSMALIHEKMYQKEDLANLDLKAYLDSLIIDLMSTYSANGEINVTIDSNLEHMEIKNLVPVALIFNELITNSLKHAFTNTKQGEINISILTKGLDVLISYRDNGNWIKPVSDNSFGMTLIETFTEQLDGEYTINLEKGTEYKFCFSTPRK
jgi:two-component system, sensor histidine kinase PdtaS